MRTVPAAAQQLLHYCAFRSSRVVVQEGSCHLEGPRSSKGGGSGWKDGNPAGARAESSVGHAARRRRRFHFEANYRPSSQNDHHCRNAFGVRLVGA